MSTYTNADAEEDSLRARPPGTVYPLKLTCKTTGKTVLAVPDLGFGCEGCVGNREPSTVASNVTICSNLPACTSCSAFDIPPVIYIAEDELHEYVAMRVSGDDDTVDETTSMWQKREW